MVTMVMNMAVVMDGVRNGERANVKTNWDFPFCLNIIVFSHFHF